jgi:hypothetical protein
VQQLVQEVERGACKNSQQDERSEVVDFPNISVDPDDLLVVDTETSAKKNDVDAY